MDKICVVCKKEGSYKCPTCLVFYCSALCCKKHRENECNVIIKHNDVAGTSAKEYEQRYTSADTVPLEKLQLLNHDESLKNLLCNPHLRDLLLTINNANDSEKIMQMAMQEPLFVEFADACLKIVEPPHGEM